MWPFSKSESKSEKWLAEQEKTRLSSCELWVQALNSRNYNGYLALLDVSKITLAGLSGLVLFLYLPTWAGEGFLLQFAPSLLTAFVGFLENTLERNCSQPIPTQDQLQERLLPALSEKETDTHLCSSIPKKICHLATEFAIPATSGFFASSSSIWAGLSTSAITSIGFGRLFTLYNNRRVMPTNNDEEEEKSDQQYSQFAANLKIQIQNVASEPIQILEGTQQQIQNHVEKAKAAQPKKSQADMLSPPDSLVGPPSTDRIDRSKEVSGPKTFI